MNFSFRRRIRFPLSHSQVMELIRYIRKHECLWDRTMPENRIKKVRDSAWHTISQAMGIQAQVLFEKWQSLQTVYRRCKKQLREHEASTISWVYFPAMEFIDRMKEDEESECLKEKNLSNGKAERKVKGKLRRKLAPSRMTLRRLVRNNYTDSLHQPELHISDVVKVEPGSHPPTPTDFDDIQMQNPSLKNPPESFSMPEQADKPASTLAPGSIQAAVINEQDEDIFFVKSVAYMLKQFPPRVKRKLQIDIHEMIITTQKQEYAKQFGNVLDG